MALPGESVLYRTARLPLLDATTTLGFLGLDLRARADAVRSLDLGPGRRVLEVACGTGRLLPRLAAAVGPTGTVVGVDRSVPLLRRARRRTRGLPNVDLRAGAFPDVDTGPPADAALCVLGMSTIEDWEGALEHMCAAVRPGGRIAVVDWLVADDQARLLNWYVRFGSWLAQSDPCRPLVAACDARLVDVTATRLPPLNLVLVRGRVPPDRDGRGADCAPEQSTAPERTAGWPARTVGT